MLETLKKIFNRGHGRFLGTLSDYIDGELPTRERAALEEHLRGCSSCTEELESLRATVQMLQRLPEVEAPRSFRISVVPAPSLTPPPERPVLLWAMRVSTALAVVAFTVMVAGNATGLFGGGGGDAPEERAASEGEFGYDSPTAMPMMEEEASDTMMTPTAMAMMPESTPAPEDMMESTAIGVKGDDRDVPVSALTADDRTTAGASLPESKPKATAMPEVTAMPQPTAMREPTAVPQRPSPAATPIPTPKPTVTPAPMPTPEPSSWAEAEEDEGGDGVAIGLTVGVGVAAALLALGTIYLTVRGRRGAGRGAAPLH